MKTFPLKLGDEKSKEAFVSFLETCRAEASARGRPQLASITLEVDHIDPLAVLESIYEAKELHFYCERPGQRMAVAGAEAVLQFECSGPDRFQAARAFIDETLENTISIGRLDLPFGGPHFFSAFGFSAAKGNGGFPFSPGTLFVPRWQVGRLEDRFTAVANLLVDAEADLLHTAERVWRAYAKFRSFDYSRPGGRVANPPRAGSYKLREVGTEDSFAESVAQALTEIRDGAYRKIVLARAVDLEADAPFHPLSALNVLRGRFPDCFSFSIGNGKGQSFIGATPERLVRVGNGMLNTEAIAGSAARGASASEDAMLANGLLRSEKDVREHAIVVESILRRLNGIGISGDAAGRPRLLQLSNVQHLHLPITASLPRGVHLLDAVSALHPTPAVGGTPRERACPRIPELEAFDRGLYAGPLGWVDAAGQGEFFVGIRSALIDGAKARAFAGAGIVEGSDPEKEKAETNLKLKALLENLI